MLMTRAAFRPLPAWGPASDGMALWTAADLGLGSQVTGRFHECVTPPVGQADFDQLQVLSVGWVGDKAWLRSLDAVSFNCDRSPFIYIVRLRHISEASWPHSQKGFSPGLPESSMTVSSEGETASRSTGSASPCE